MKTEKEQEQLAKDYNVRVLIGCIIFFLIVLFAAAYLSPVPPESSSDVTACQANALNC